MRVVPSTGSSTANQLLQPTGVATTGFQRSKCDPWNLCSPSIRPRPGQGTLARIFSISEVVKARIVCVRIWLDPNRKKTTKMLGIFVLIFGSLRTPQIHSKFNLLYAGSKNV